MVLLVWMAAAPPAPAGAFEAPHVGLQPHALQVTTLLVEAPITSTPPLPPGNSSSEPSEPHYQRATEAAEARAEVEARIAQLGSETAAAHSLQQEALIALDALDALDAALVSAQQLSLATEAAATASQQTATESEVAVQSAKDIANLERARLRDAAVELFINPPQQDSLRVVSLESVEDSQTGSALLSGRVDTSLAVVADATSNTKKAKRTARNTSVRAEHARTAAVSARADEQRLAAEVDTRREDLRSAQARIEALELETAELVAMDKVLAARLEVAAVATAGYAQARPSEDGSWSISTANLPTRDDMVKVPDTTIWVHQLIFEQVSAMVDAAFADGVRLDGWGYRDTQRQIELRRQHCGPTPKDIFEKPSSQCSPPTATPGRSMHERGLAIDFSTGTATLDRATAQFQWLAANTAGYGLFNLPSEPWHWSVNGR